MPSTKYMEMYKGYWPKASELIYDLISRNVKPDDKICEVGFASGHLLVNLALEGFSVSGYEVRNDVYEKTYNKFQSNGIVANLYNKDVMDATEKYDLLYSTGLLQCLTDTEREKMISKFAGMTEKLIIVVPHILQDRGDDAEAEVGVAGCREYQTSSIESMLRSSFEQVHCGKWSRKEMELSDEFRYYICGKKRK